MIPYRDWSPTPLDPDGLGLEDQQDWLVAPVMRTRDSDCLAESNFAATERALAAVDPDGLDHEEHSFDHWGPGWFNIIIVRPGSRAAQEAEAIEVALSDYPVLDEDDFCERETEAANELWSYMRQSERIDYIRRNREQFEFRNLADMAACVRGKYFAGWASELLS